MDDVTKEADHVLIKRGLYYRPNGNGYTGLKSEAGLYHASYALGFAGVEAVPFIDAPVFAPACWEETKIAYFETALTAAQSEAEAKDAEIAALREVDRLAGIASRWHWFGSGAVDDYEDNDDLFQDLDNARRKALDASRAALTETQP